MIQARNRSLMFLVLAGMQILMLVGCSSMSVRTDFDHDYDFSFYQTYRWAIVKELNPNDALQRNPLVGDRVKASVDRVLQAKGFKLMETGEVDFVVVVHAGVQEKMEVTDWGTSYYGGGWYNPWWGSYGGHTDVSYYKEGTLVIDVVNAKKMKLTWRGLGTATVKDYKDSKKMEADIDKAVNKILASFPPGAEK